MLNGPPASPTISLRFVVDREASKFSTLPISRNQKPVTNALVPSRTLATSTFARTYAYVSAASKDSQSSTSKNLTAPKLDNSFTAESQLNDVNDVKSAWCASALLLSPTVRMVCAY